MTRIRSRKKRNHIVTTQTINSTGGIMQERKVQADGATESMTDVSNASWRSSKPTPLVVPTRLGGGHAGVDREKYRKLTRGLPRVNNLTYRCLADKEIPGEIQFRLGAAPPWLTVKGCCYTMLTGDLVILETPPSVTATEMALLMREAKSRLLIQVSDPQYSFGEPIAEIRSTSDFIRKPLDSLGKLSKEFFREVTRSSLGRQSLRVAAVWNTYRFAFSPLVRTVDDSMQALADGMYRKYRRGFTRATQKVSAEGVGFATHSFPSKSFPWPVYSIPDFEVVRMWKRTVTREARCGLFYYHEDKGSLASLLGLRARDIPVIAWELFPLSFMFDRLYNIKGCISASMLFLSSKVKFTGGWESTRQNTVDNRSLSSLRSLSPTWVTNITPALTNPRVSNDFNMSRARWAPVISDVPPPKEAGRLVDTLAHQLDLASILTTRVSRVIRKI